MIRSIEATGRAINAMVEEAEMRLRLAPSPAEVKTLRTQLTRAGERFRRLERCKLEYEQRVWRHVEEYRRAELNFIAHFLATNDLIGFLKCEVRKVIASRDEAVAAAVRETRMVLNARYRELLGRMKEKFERKEKEVTAEIHLQERLANLQLLEDLAEGRTTIPLEMEKLKKELPAAEPAFKEATVSVFIIEELVRPEASIASVNREDMAIHSCPPHL